jgi:hypothetical protein
MQTHNILALIGLNMMTIRVAAINMTAVGMMTPGWAVKTTLSPDQPLRN